MSENYINIDTDGGEILKILNDLTDDNYIKSKVLLTALKKGGEVLKENTRKIMVSKLGHTATKLTKHKNPKYDKKKPMSEGVSVYVDKDYHDVIVSILKDYRLKWFEKGTTERLTKGTITGRAKITKGDGERWRNVRDNNRISRGSIEGVGFFAQAREETTGIDDAVIASLNDSFNKLFKA